MDKSGETRFHECVDQSLFVFLFVCVVLPFVEIFGVHVACFSAFFKICWVPVLFFILFLVSYFFCVSQK